MEPSKESVEDRWRRNEYEQICGSTEALKGLPDGHFDVIICHNVLEYAPDREEIVREFCCLLKGDGYISLVKHNRPGRVMQMVVLLDDFDHANSLLDGDDGKTADFGAIHYYEDGDLLDWCKDLRITKAMGLRTFWDLQQKQEMHKNAEWQRKMADIELRVSEIEEYRNIAFFHHLILEKTEG